MASVVVAVVEWAVQRDDATRRNNFAIFIAQLSRWLSRLWLSSVWLPSGRLKPPAPCPLSPSLPLALEARQIKPLSAGEFAVRVRYFRCSQAAGSLSSSLPDYLSPSLSLSPISLSCPICLCLSLSPSALTFIKQTARTQTVQLFAQWVTQSTGHPVNKSCTHSLTHSLIESFTLIHSLIHSLQLASHAVANCRRANNENINEHNIK